jgi:hypothetical protein
MRLTYAELWNRIERAGQEEAKRQRAIFQSLAREKLTVLEDTLGQDLMGVLEEHVHYNFYEDKTGNFALIWGGVPIELRASRGRKACVEAYWYTLLRSGTCLIHKDLTKENFCEVFAEIARNGVDPDDHEATTYMGLDGSAAQEAMMNHLIGTSLTGTALQRVHQLMEIEEAARNVFVNPFGLESVEPQLVPLSEVRKWEVIVDDSPPF